MITALFGYSGFVGSNILLKKKFDYLFNSKNIIEAKNMNFDEIYFCSLPAVKWYANKNEKEDTKIINNIIEILKTVNCKKFILISTIDVYSKTDNLDNEESIINYLDNHVYGKNRYIFENFIKNKFKNYFIIRLPALFGHGLKKNILYDLLSLNQIDKIPFNSKFQWYNLDWIVDDIEIVIKNEIRECNFFTEPLETNIILEIFDYPKEIYNYDKNITYNLTTKYFKFFDSNIDNYIRGKNQIKKDIINFIQFENKNKSNLCISNICVNNISHEHFSIILKTIGIKNVEVAPTKLCEWKNIQNLNLNIYSKNNIKTYSFQSITYTLNEFNIFDNTKNELLEHLFKVVDIAFKNKVEVLVFGCPKNRKILNFKDNYYDKAIDFFNKLGNYCKNKNIIICIENNSKKYNCNFLNSINEIYLFVKKVNNKNIKMMVDLGNCIMENDDINNILLYKDEINHIHISQEFMRAYLLPNDLNYKFKKNLDIIKYKFKITLEMLIDNKQEEIYILVKSIKNLINIYG